MNMLVLIGVGATALSLAVGTYAMAATVKTSEMPPGYHARHETRHMRAQDYNHFDYGIARPTYHSGWGGPYGDSDYPGSVGQNMGPSY